MLVDIVEADEQQESLSEELQRGYSLAGIVEPLYYPEQRHGALRTGDLLKRPFDTRYHAGHADRRGPSPAAGERSTLWTRRLCLRPARPLPICPKQKSGWMVRSSWTKLNALVHLPGTSSLSYTS